MGDAVLPGLAAFRAAVERLHFDLAALVAAVGLWVPPDLQRGHVSPTNPAGAVYPRVRRARMGSGERPGATIDGIRLDRNNYAGAAIREALGGRGKALGGYQACHVWPDTCYDPRYHTSLANLVLVPAPLVSLTDHDPDVMAALKFRAFELYGWHPSEESAPPRPPRYPTTWLEPRALPRPQRAAKHAPETPRHAGSATGERQRDAIIRLWKLHHGDRERVERELAAGLRSGQIQWRSNRSGMSPENYAYRLWRHANQHGWFG